MINLINSYLQCNVNVKIYVHGIRKNEYHLCKCLCSNMKPEYLTHLFNLSIPLIFLMTVKGDSIIKFCYDYCLSTVTFFISIYLNRKKHFIFFEKAETTITNIKFTQNTLKIKPPLKGS